MCIYKRKFPRPYRTHSREREKYLPALNVGGPARTYSSSYIRLYTQHCAKESFGPLFLPLLCIHTRACLACPFFYFTFSFTFLEGHYYYTQVYKTPSHRTLRARKSLIHIYIATKARIAYHLSGISQGSPALWDILP